MKKPDAHYRSRYKYFSSVPTRWMDNDIYGHVNNVVYLSYFDTAINSFLIKEGNFDINLGNEIGVCVESHCNYFKPIKFPETISVGLRVENLSLRSVKYEIGLFSCNDENTAAQGWFIHVFVCRNNMKPVKIPDHIKQALIKIKI